MKVENPHLPANHQDIDDIPEEVPYYKKEKKPISVEEVFVGSENKRLFKASSSTEEGTYYMVERVKTVAGTYVFKCECTGYITRRRANPFFECVHIKTVKDRIAKGGAFKE
jgi:hypothetical protein